MSIFFPFIKKPKNYLPGHKHGPTSVLNRHIVFGVLTFIILACLFGSLIYQRYLIVKQEQKKEAFVKANNAKDRFHEVLANSLSATRMLSFFVDNKGEVKNFDSVAAQILNTNKNIDILELVPDGVIQYVYPLKGNESVIGYNILKDPSRNKEALKAIQKNELFFSGPYNLKQGGFGIVGRLPVFRNGKFWGFSAVVIKISTLLKATGLNNTGEDGYYYQLSKINPDTKKQEFFIPHIQQPLSDYFFSVEIPDGDWKLSVEPINTNKGISDVFILCLLGLLFSVLGAVFVFIMLKRPEKLDRLVKERTKELKGSENKYRSLIERVSDAFVSLDNNWNYTYVNKKAGEILARKPESLVGKHIWTEFPEGINQPFYLAYYKAMETQEYQCLEEYYPPFDKWLENHIYPSNDGLTIFFKDVTEIKKVSLALIENEEKYRSLIEQATDGIILYSFDGTIHSFNKAAYIQTGYTEQEFQKLNLNDLFVEVSLTNKKPKDKKLETDEPAILYRKLKRKDGSVFNVELNARLLPDGKIFAIVRDITEREKAEQARMHEEQTRQLIMNSALDAIICINAEGAITLWNLQAEKIFGWSEEEINGKLLTETIIPHQYQEQHEKGMKHYLQTGEGPVLNRMFEITALDRQGREFPIELSIVPMQQEGQQSFCAFIRDITERRKATEEINKSNERFDLIAQATNDAVWDHDFIKNETWGNKELYDLYGFEYGKEKIDLEMFFSRLHPDEREGLEQRMKDAIGQSVSSLSETFRFKTADGNYKTFYDRAHIKYDTGNKPVRILGAMHDITDRELIKQQILKEKELSDSVINSLPGVFYLVKKGGKFLRWNKNMETVTGYTTEEISEMHPLDFFDKTDQPLMLAKIANVFALGTDEVEIDFLLKNKQKIPYYFNGQAIEYEGEVCLMGVGLDFSEREKAGKALRESEERYRSLVENATEALVVFDVETQLFVSVSESASILFKMTKKELLNVGPVHVSPQYQPDGRLSSDAAREYIKKAIKGEKPSFEWMHCDKGGKPIPCEVWLVHLPAENKMLIRASVIDITERKKAKELLQKSYDDIRQLASNLQSIREDERTNISREIHDELGQQLTGLKMDLHWLKRKINSSDEEISNKMTESMELVNATITSVRKIATDLRPGILDDLGLIAALEWQGDEFKKRSGTDVEFINKVGDIVLPPMAVTGIFRIYQELLTNIARHANATLVKTTLEKKGKRLYFCITDNGSGFNLETINNKSTLGLLGIKERTLLLDGTYEFKSEPGKGSETIISIPMDH
ncbi:MAG: PAS domain S-box protein [Ferruginibacter sp.]